MNKIIQYFLSTTDLIEEEDFNKAKILIGALLFTSLLNVIGFPILFYITDIYMSAVCMLSFIFGLVNLFYFKYTNNYERSITLFAFNGLVFMYGITFFTGGLVSPFIIWLVFFPAISILLDNRGQLKIISLAVIILIILLGIIHFCNIPIPSSITKETTLLFILANLLSIGGFITWMMLEYDNNNKEFNQKLQESNKELERFAYIASHDLKSPLRNITSFAQLLKIRARKKLSDNEKEYLQFIEDNARKMNALVQSILEFSQIDKIGEKYQEAVDLNKVVGAATMNLEALIKEKNALIETQMLPMVQGNETQMLQLFQNLIENGIKYNTSDQPIIMIKTDRDWNKNLLFFADNGIGISEEYHEKVFEMFKRLHGEEKYKGTGIGLALCKKIATKHNGDLTIEASTEKGTVFKLSLPTV